MVGFDLPEGWESVVSYTEAPRGSYAEIRENMPDRGVVSVALDKLLSNIRFENSYPQDSYVESLSLK